jgi:GNAT superfamily N-acetyltransferase
VNADATITIRRADLGDVAWLARHRVEMFREMGRLQAHAVESMRAASVEYFVHAIPAGDYVAWVATPSEGVDAGAIIAGAGMLIRPALPSPDASGAAVVTRQGLIVNVYTESDWRRQGIAARLMRVVLDWAEARGLRWIILHASAEGRSLYEKLGFEASNEMRYWGAAS